MFFTPASFKVLIQWVWKLNGIPFIGLLKIPFQFLHFSKKKAVLAKVHILQIEQPLSTVSAVWLSMINVDGKAQGSIFRNAIMFSEPVSCFSNVNYVLEGQIFKGI